MGADPTLPKPDTYAWTNEKFPQLKELLCGVGIRPLAAKANAWVILRFNRENTKA
jgi:hypothetical protein